MLCFLNVLCIWVSKWVRFESSLPKSKERLAGVNFNLKTSTYRLFTGTERWWGKWRAFWFTTHLDTSSPFAFVTFNTNDLQKKRTSYQLYLHDKSNINVGNAMNYLAFIVRIHPERPCLRGIEEQSEATWRNWRERSGACTHCGKLNEYPTLPIPPLLFSVFKNIILHIFLIIIIIIRCSGMFRDVLECFPEFSGMFHVPGFIDSH